MPTIEEIKTQIQNLEGTHLLLTRKDMEKLSGILREDEKVEGLVQGMYANRTGLLVATNKRLFFADKGLFSDAQVEEFPYGNIRAVEYEAGIFRGKITIFTPENEVKIRNFNPDLTKKLAESIKARIPNVKESTGPAKPLLGKADIISQLERLAKLKEKGIITEEEFAAQKKKILGS